MIIKESQHFINKILIPELSLWYLLLIGTFIVSSGISNEMEINCSYLFYKK